MRLVQTFISSSIHKDDLSFSGPRRVQVVHEETSIDRCVSRWQEISVSLDTGTERRRKRTAIDYTWDYGIETRMFSRRLTVQPLVNHLPVDLNFSESELVSGKPREEVVIVIFSSPGCVA